jgi:tetratricopeptide (TPR) repeat protein
VHRLFAPALVVATLWVYAPVRGHGFLDFDDALYVASRPEVLRGLDAGGVAWAFSNLEVGNWHPLTWLSHMLDVELFGPDPGAMHLENVVLHAANAWLVYWLLLRATGSAARSAFAAAVFALHPLRVESVAWIAERKDVLAAFGFLLALGAYGRWCAAPSAGRAALVGLAALASLLAKAMAVTLPAVLLLLDAWPLRRLRDASELPARIREKIPLALLCAAVAGVALVAQARGGAMAALDVVPPGDRVANALVSLVLYLRDAAWPSALSVFHPHPRGGLPLWQPLAAASLLAVLTALAFRVRRSQPWWLVGWLWFVVMLLPVIGLVQVGVQARADRYTYLPLLGPLVAVTWGIAEACAGRAVARALPLLAAAVLVALAITTRATLAHWQNDETLFARAAAVTRDNAVAYVNWAKELDDRPEQQRLLLERALALEPRMPAAHYEMGRALANGGDSGAAEAAYRLALRGDPGHARAHNNLGNLLLQSGRLDEAILHYREALRLEPGRASSTHNLGVALRSRADQLAQQGHTVEADAARREADVLAAQPARPEVAR